jgi:hypothetical protein
MTYRLSTRQRKDLLARAQTLRIALPAPADDPPDWVAWARSALDPLDQEYVTAAEVDVLTVRPPMGRDGLASVIGDITTDDHAGLCWRVEVVIVTLEPLGGARHAAGQVRWPGSARIAGLTWPRE